MWILLAKLTHRQLQGVCFVRTREGVSVEGFHEFRRTHIVGIPQCEQDAARSRIEEAANQSKQFVAADDRIEAGTAPAERHELG